MPSTRRLALASTLLLPLVIAPLAARAATGDSAPAVGFTHEVTVDPQRLAGEPNLAIADNGRELYTSAPWGFSTTTSFAWKSEDGGVQWDALHGCASAYQHLTCSRGGGDAEFQLGTPRTPGGPQAVYYEDLNSLDTITCAYSYDGANSWSIAGTDPSGASPSGAPNGGEACNVASGQPPGSDRQWIAVWRAADNGTNEDKLYTVFDMGDTPPSNDSLIYSNDSGRTWTKGATFMQGATNYPSGNMDGTRPGPLVINPKTGVLYQFYEVNTGGTAVLLSCDHGLTFKRFDIAPAGTFTNGTTADFVVGAIDTAGNLYSAWTVSNGGSVTGAGNSNFPYRVYYSHTVAGGTTPAGCPDATGTKWSAPVPVTGPPAPSTRATEKLTSPFPEVTNGVMPWIVAGDPGRVDIAYYGTTHAMPYNPNSQVASWYVYLAQSTNGLDDAPAWTNSQATETPMHHSSICFNGIGCSATQGNRNLSDFFEVKADPQGRASIIYTDDNNSAVATPNGNPGGPLVAYIQQASGPSLYANSFGGTGIVADPSAGLQQSLDQRSTVVDSTGDALMPAHGVPPAIKGPGANVPAADVTAVHATLKDGTLHLTLDLKSLAGGPTSAIVQPPQAPQPHTGAQWVVTWRKTNADQSSTDLYFAAAAVDGAGNASFFAGKPQSEPLTGGGPKAFGYVASPQTTKAETGSFDAAANRVTINVPLADIGAATTDQLYGLQGFTFDVLGANGATAPFADQVDATAPIDVPLSSVPADLPESTYSVLLAVVAGLAFALIAVRRRRSATRSV